MCRCLRGRSRRSCISVSNARSAVEWAQDSPVASGAFLDVCSVDPVAELVAVEVDGIYDVGSIDSIAGVVADDAASRLKGGQGHGWNGFDGGVGGVDGAQSGGSGGCGGGE